MDASYLPEIHGCEATEAHWWSEVEVQEDLKPTCYEICLGMECGPVLECSCGTCTGNDNVCQAGVCVCGPKCDGKQCGSDTCGGLCGVCPDGSYCSLFEQCVAFACNIGPFGVDVSKITSFSSSFEAHPGEALDVDGNPATCAPTGNCENGLDNSFGAFLRDWSGTFEVDYSTKKLFADGKIIWLIELVEPTTDGSNFEVSLLRGTWDSSIDGCNPQTESCDYYVTPDSYTLPDCMPLTRLTQATITDGVLQASGGSDEWEFHITFPEALYPWGNGPVMEVFTSSVRARRLKIRAAVEVGDTTIVTGGILAGALRKSDLIEAVSLWPYAVETVVGFQKEVVIDVIESFLVLDIDTDGDGTADAASFAFQFQAIGGAIVGVDI